MSQSDALTGLLNRHCYEQRIAEPVGPEHSSLTCLYADANGLHRINNEQGHDAGDALLCCVADAMRDIFGDEQVFRIGGDEFVALLPDEELAAVREKTAELRKRVEARGYSVAVGMERGLAPCSIRPMLRSAELKMQEDKQRWHTARS